MIPAGSSQEGPSGGKICAEHPTRVIRERYEVGASLSVPERRGAVSRAGTEDQTVGADPGDAGDRNSVHPGQVEGSLEVSQFPHTHLLVPASTGETTAIWAE